MSTMTIPREPHILLGILKEEMEIKLKGGLYHQTQIKFAYNSNRIEGNRLSEEQTRYIFETNTIGAGENGATNVDDIIETVNHFTCFDYMISHSTDALTENLFCEYHRILKSGTSDTRKDWFNVGKYKARPNVVGDMKTTPPTEVSDEIKRLLTAYYHKKTITFNDIIWFHYEFERIHPFQDGNGRVGRIILFKECLVNNIVPFIIDHSHKMYYYRGLREWINETGFLLDICRSAQDNYMKLVDYFYPEVCANDDR